MSRRHGDLIECRLWARSFLHHQVRNIVGTLKTVGEGKAPIGHVRGGAGGARPRRGGADGAGGGAVPGRAEFDAGIRD